MIKITLEQLKKKIIDKDLDNSPLIFKYTDNKFLCYQYANEIAKVRNLQKQLIDDINVTLNDESFFDVEDTTLYILDTDKLVADVTADMLNLIVICKDVPKQLSIDFIEFSKLLPWQIEDYVKTRLPGLLEVQAKWLCEITKYNIYRIDQECRKIEIFPEGTQKLLFDQLNMENAYNDLNTYSIFDFTNALMRKDVNKVKDILSELDYVDIEGTGLVTIFHKQFRNLIQIKMNPRATAESLGITPGQFKMLSYNYKNLYTEKQLINIYNFITSINQNLMAGKYSFTSNNRENNKMLVHYITNNLIRFGEMR